MLAPGDSVPHVTVRTVDGGEFRYRSVWQHRNVVLVLLPAGTSRAAEAYASDLASRRDAFDAREAVVVVTRDPVPRVEAPAVVVADRWGEIVHTAAGSTEDLPSMQDLLEWLDYLASRCPECEGETR